jgi:hypothetical protein
MDKAFMFLTRKPESYRSTRVSDGERPKDAPESDDARNVAHDCRLLLSVTFEAESAPNEARNVSHDWWPLSLVTFEAEPPTEWIPLGSLLNITFRIWIGKSIDVKCFAWNGSLQSVTVDISSMFMKMIDWCCFQEFGSRVWIVSQSAPATETTDLTGENSEQNGYGLL